MYADFTSTFSIVFIIFGFLFRTALYWLPFVLGAILWDLWMNYIRTVFLSEIKWTLLGIRLPQAILKTPLAMELVLLGLHKTTEGSWLERHFKGTLKEWFSLELVSIEGEIRYFIRVKSNLKNFVEAQLYSQFPGLEIYEAEDYVNEIGWEDLFSEGANFIMYGTEFALTKPDSYPIKTYVDYGLDTVIKKAEEAPFRTDPLTPTIEFLSTLRKGERVWIQIIARATGNRFAVPGSWFGAKRSWRDEAEALVAKMQKKGEGEKLSKSESEVISAIEREISKFGFDCGIRSIYIAEKDKFDGAVAGGMKGLFKQYSSETFNGIKPVDGTGGEYPFTNYDYDLGKLEVRYVPKMKRKMFRAYRERGYFYIPFKNRKKPFILNTEELATIYHFPSGLETPGFVTLSSHKAEPPANLPI